MHEKEKPESLGITQSGIDFDVLREMITAATGCQLITAAANPGTVNNETCSIKCKNKC